MRTCHLVVFALTTLIVCSFVFSCSNDMGPAPDPEYLDSFSITVPDTVTPGEPFDITVTAIGSKGSSPYTWFGGEVVLTASGGTITPDTLRLTGGTGSGQVVLSGSSDTQTITATGGHNAQGSVVINARFMTALEGDPTDSANEAIPGFEFFADADDYTDNHPSLPGMYVSHNTIMVAFEPGTSVEQANTILTSIGADIIGGIPGDDATAPGIIFLRLPTSTHAELNAVIATLEANAHINTVVQDILMGTNEIPRPNDGDPPLWTWDSTPGGANWGLERIRVPQMWNFNEAVDKKKTVGSWPPSTVQIVDEGFARYHEDVPSLSSWPRVTDPHGTHVAGIIGAEYNNGKGIDGVCPFVLMGGISVQVSGGIGPYMGRISAGQAIISSLYWRLRAYVDVVNMSIGYNWADASIDSDNDVVAQAITANQAQLLVHMLNLNHLRIGSPLIIVSAGNDSGRGFGDQEARYNSPMCYAALEMGIKNIIVVEAVMDSPGTGAGDVTRYPGSNVGGHVSAPGFDVWGTTSESSLYRSGDGTSYAAAMVSGLAAYMRVLENYLTYSDMKNIILANTLSAGGGAQGRVDAWASIVDIDRVRVGSPVLKMMCDIDDGSFDGNQYYDYYGQTDYHNEDIDSDQGIGDGDVDMSDFRRWRDWYLLTQTSIEYDLTGAADHPKKDVNNNGTVEDAAGESLFPRGDFNGDGQLDETALSYVPGAIAANATDLDVLRAAFDDPHYNEWELPDLIESGDIEIHITQFIPAYGASFATVRLWNGGHVMRTRIITDLDPHAVITAPTIQGGYGISIDISGSIDSDTFEYDNGSFPLETGNDIWLAPIKTIHIDPQSTYLHVCSDDAAVDAHVYKLSDLGIRPGQHIILDQVGSYNAGGGYDYVENLSAVFSSTSQLSGSGSLHRVTGAIDAGVDYVTEPTWDCGGEATDIPEDFSCQYHAEVKVPPGAVYIFIGVPDVKYSDNSDPDDDFGVQITRFRMNGFN